MKNKRLAILEFSPPALTALLQLPEGAELVAVRHNDRRGVLELTIEGAGWETPLGSAIPRTTAIVKQDGERSRIDWGFPDAVTEGVLPRSEG